MFFVCFVTGIFHTYLTLSLCQVIVQYICYKSEDYKPSFQLLMTHSLPKNSLFFMETIFIDSYMTIEEYYRVIFAKLTEFKNEIFFMDLLQNWYIYSICPQ